MTLIARQRRRDVWPNPLPPERDRHTETDRDRERQAETERHGKGRFLLFCLRESGERKKGEGTGCQTHPF